MAEDKKAAPAAKKEESKEDSLFKAIADGEEKLEKAKEAHIKAGDDLEKARSEFADFRGEQAQKTQVKVNG